MPQRRFRGRCYCRARGADRPTAAAASSTGAMSHPAAWAGTREMLPPRRDRAASPRGRRICQSSEAQLQRPSPQAEALQHARLALVIGTGTGRMHVARKQHCAVARRRYSSPRTAGLWSMRGQCTSVAPRRCHYNGELDADQRAAAYVDTPSKHTLLNTPRVCEREHDKERVSSRSPHAHLTPEGHHRVLSTRSLVLGYSISLTVRSVSPSTLHTRTQGGPWCSCCTLP